MAVVSAAAPHGDVIEALADRFKDNVHWQAALAQGLSRHGQKDLVESARNAARQGFEQQLIEDPENKSAIEDLSELLFDAARRPLWLPVLSSGIEAPDGQPAARDSIDNVIVDTAAATPASLMLPPLPDSVKAVRIETGNIESIPQTVMSPLENYRTEFLDAPRSDSGSLLGRYVRVDKPEDSNRYPRSPDDIGHMNFAEVEVFGGENNLALGKEARQTATWREHVAGRAVDGNRNGVLDDNSSAHSDYVENEAAWWEVDLGAVQSIDRIVFWNRTDRYWSARTNYVRIRVLDEQRKIIFEQLVGRAPRPSCEIDCHSLLSTVDPTAEGETRWSFRVSGTASFESLTGCRISVAEKMPSLEQDNMVYSARNVPADSRRVAAAYAINGLALGRLEGQPDDGDLNVALIRHATANAQLALSSNSLDELLPELELAAKVADKLTAAPPAWTVLSPVEMSSQNGSKLELQDDRSVFVSAPTDKDVYSLVFETDLEAIKAIRLEALADSRLPGNGPGHFDGTFVLSGLAIEPADGDRPGQTELLQIHRARADYSQALFPVKNSIDGNDSKGWAIQPRTGENHTAVFEIDETQVKRRPARVTVRLEQLSGHKKNLLGRFRVSFTDDKSVAEDTKARLRLSESELVEFYVALGTARARAGQQDDAVAAFVRALNLSSDHEIKATILAAASVTPEVLNQVTGGDEGRAAAQDLDVQLALARLSSVRGQQALVAGKPAEALVELKRADELFTKLLGAPTQWHTLTPVELSSEEGSQLKLLDDGSIFVSDPANQDVFSITVQSDLKGIQGLRLETLPDSDLGIFNGPGLGKADNFVLTGLALEAASNSQRDSPVAISFEDAWADYSEEGFNVQGVLDGSPDSGWKISPQINQIHTAVFEAAKEAGGGDLPHLTIRLAHESSLERALIGRFRLSLTDDPATPKLTGLQLALKDDELADTYIALGTAFAQQGMNDDAADAFSRGIQQIGERSVRVVTAAATWPEVLKNLATSNDVPVLASLARYHAWQGNRQQAADVRDKARALLEKQRADAPADPMLVAELADLLLDDTDVIWTVIKPDEMQSTGGATLTAQSDGSILAVGFNPARDSYTVAGLSTLKRITAIQLEALSDPSLPHNGPGRVRNGNFNMHMFEVLSQGDPQRLTDIHASFRPGRYLHSIIDGSIDGGIWDGWGMVGRENSLLLATDFERAIDDKLEFKLQFSHTRDKHNLGRFRLLASDDPQAFEREKQRFEARTLADPWQRLAAAYRFIGDQESVDKLLRQTPKAEQESPE